MAILLLGTMSLSKCSFKGNGLPVRMINVLCLGNSYTVDAFAYVPCLLRMATADVQFNICLLHRDKFTLNDHYEYGVNGNRMYTLYCFDGGEKKWSSTKQTLLSALKSRDWDMVVLQQGSLDSRIYDRYQPCLNKMIRWLLPKVNQSCCLAWLETPAWPEGCHGLKGEKSDSMARDIARCTLKLMDEEPIEVMFPVGRAIQHARNMGMANVGDFGYMCYDEFHLQDGLPRLAAALVATQQLLQWSGCDSLKMGDVQKLKIDEEWLELYNIPQRHGKPVSCSPQDITTITVAIELALEAPL